MLLHGCSVRFFSAFFSNVFCTQTLGFTRLKVCVIMKITGGMYDDRQTKK